MKTINFRFELIIEHRFEGSQFRIHDDNGTGYTGFSQLRAFVGNRYSQIIHPVILKGFGYLIRTGSISRCLHHAHHLCLRFQFTTIIIQIINQCIQFDFQNCLMYFQLQAFRNIIEMKAAWTFYQDNLITQIGQQVGFQQVFCAMKKILL